MSLPTRGAWIEMPCPCFYSIILESLPTRGAWIEISDDRHYGPTKIVAPHAGSVD